MGVTLVQTKTGSTALNSTALALALSSNTVTGDMIIVAVTIDDNADDISSVTSTGTSFSKITSASGLTGDGFTYLSVWYAFNVTGETTPTVTINKSTSVSIEAVLRHYRGVTTTTPLDKVASASGGTTASPSSTPNSGATAALSQTNELVVGISGSDFGGATYTLGATYGNLVQIANPLDTSEMGTEDKTVAATTAVTATFTISNATTWRCSVLTFLIAGSSTTTAVATWTATGSLSAVSKALKKESATWGPRSSLSVSGTGIEKTKATWNPSAAFSAGGKSLTSIKGAVTWISSAALSLTGKSTDKGAATFAPNASFTPAGKSSAQTISTWAAHSMLSARGKSTAKGISTWASGAVLSLTGRSIEKGIGAFSPRSLLSALSQSSAKGVLTTSPHSSLSVGGKSSSVSIVTLFGQTTFLPKSKPIVIRSKVTWVPSGVFSAVSRVIITLVSGKATFSSSASFQAKSSRSWNVTANWSSSAVFSAVSSVSMGYAFPTKHLLGDPFPKRIKPLHQRLRIGQ